MSNITLAVRHPIVSLVGGAFTVYTGYWAVQQVHWFVTHAFTVLLFAALVVGIGTVTRKAKRQIVDSSAGGPQEASADDVVSSWAPPIMGLPRGTSGDPIDAAYQRLMAEARNR